MTLLNSEIPKSESQLKPILHWNTNNTKINWQIRERNLCNTKPIHHLIPTESLFWNLYCIYVITGFVLDLSTKGRFSTQWVADYLKLPLLLKEILCAISWRLEGSSGPSFSHHPLLPPPSSNLSLALQLWIKLHSCFPQHLRAASKGQPWGAAKGQPHLDMQPALP